MAFIDNNSAIIDSYIGSIPVISPEDIGRFEFDKIVVAVSPHNGRAEIVEQLKSCGIKDEEVEILDYYDFYPYDEKSDARVIWLRDFARYAKESNIKGSVAECGVSSGSFARFINKYFYDSRLYLFDTFEGFDKKDLEFERSLNNDAFLNGMFNTLEIFLTSTAERAMRRMPFPEKCVIKKGYFPDTAADVLDAFCFVNLDMDLYLPMLAALKFFWDKMTCGGVILLHDYFHPELPGVKNAVDDFEMEIQKNVCKVTIGDFNSIAIIKGHDD